LEKIESQQKKKSQKLLFVIKPPDFTPMKLNDFKVGADFVIACLILLLDGLLIVGVWFHLFACL
jgi:hypothetical protein